MFLEGLNAVDLGLLINGEDFAVTTDMTETFNQTVTYFSGFGTDGPLGRNVRISDSGEVSFTCTLLKSGVAKGMNDEKKLLKMRDFELITKRGDGTNSRTVYQNCNWTSVTVRSSIDTVTLDAAISVPGFQDVAAAA